jgi:hypothetical protein
VTVFQGNKNKNLSLGSASFPLSTLDLFFFLSSLFSHCRPNGARHRQWSNHSSWPSGTYSLKIFGPGIFLFECSPFLPTDELFGHCSMGLQTLWYTKPRQRKQDVSRTSRDSNKTLHVISKTPAVWHGLVGLADLGFSCQKSSPFYFPSEILGSHKYNINVQNLYFLTDIYCTITSSQKFSFLCPPERGALAAGELDTNSFKLRHT